MADFWDEEDKKQNNNFWDEEDVYTPEQKQALKSGAIVTPELKGQNGETVTESSVEYPTYRTEQGQVKKTWFHPVDFAKSLGKGVFHGVNALGTGLGKRVANPLRQAMGKQPLTDYEIENIYGKMQGLPEQGGAYKTGKFVGETAPYFLLPETKLAGLGTWGNRALTYGYQGGLAGELNSIAEKGWNPKENLKDAGISAVGAIALGSAVAKGGDKLARLQRARNVMKRRNTPLAERMTAEQTENAYINRGLNKRLDEIKQNPDVINDENFYKGLENLPDNEQTTLLNKVEEIENGKRINELKLQRQQNQQAKSEEIARINAERQEALKGASFNNPSAKINKQYDKQIRQAQQKYNSIENDLKGQMKDLSPEKTDLNSLKSDIGDVAFPKSESQYSYETNAVKGNYYRRNIDDPMSYDAKTYMQKFNKYVQDIKNNPSLVDDEAFMLGFQNDIKNAPDFMADELSQKIDELVTRARKYNEFKLNKTTKPEWEQITDAEYNAINNPVDDVVTPETPKTTIEGTGEVTNRGLAESVMNAKGTPKEVKQAISENMPQYRVLKNNDLSEQAIKEVEADFNNELSRLSTADDFEALDYEKARQLTKRLFDMGRNDEAINLIDRVSENATKKGQAIQSLALWNNMTGEGVVAKAQKLVRQANKKLPDKKKINLSDEQIAKLRELGNAIQNTEEGTRENAVAIAQAMKETADIVPKGLLKKVDSYRYINMLLSGKSRFKDFILTGINAGDSAIDELLANGIDMARSTITGKPRVYGGLQPKAWGKGFAKGWNEAIEDIKLGINTSRSGERGRYGLPNTRSFEYTPFKEIGKNLKEAVQSGNIKDIAKTSLSSLKNAGENVLAVGEDGLSYTIRVPDRSFYEARFSSSLADQMKVAGVKEPTQEMVMQAQKEALKSVFQDKSWVSTLGNKTRDTVNSAMERLEEGLKLPFSLPKPGDFLAPFVTTPANIINLGIENTAGGIPGIAQMLTAKTPQELRTAEMLLAKNIKGLIASGLLGEGIYQGAIKSNIGKDDYNLNSIEGLRPESIVIGDKAFSIKDYPQLAIPVNTYLGLREGGLPQAVANNLKAVGEMSALKSVGDLMKSFEPAYPGEEQEDNYRAKVINRIARTQGANLISQFLPFGGQLGEIRNDVDPYTRELRMPMGNTNSEMAKNTAQYIKNRLQNRLPIASTKLPIKYNAIGQPVMTNNIKNPVARVLSEDLDFGVRNYTGNETYNKLRDFQESVRDTNYKGKTNTGLNMPSRNITVNGEKIKMNNKQYSEYTKDFGRINYKLKDWAINSPEFNNMSDEEKVEYLSTVKQSVEEAVKIMQYGHTPTRKLKEYTQYILDNYKDLTAD